MGIQQLIMSAFSGGGGIKILDSVRMRGVGSGVMNRTMGAATDRPKYTFHARIKNPVRAVDSPLFGAFLDTLNNYSNVYITTTGAVRVTMAQSGTPYAAITTALLRDPSAWYDILYVADTNNAVAAERAKIYVNGVLLPFTSNNLLQTTVMRFNGPNGHYINRFGHTAGFGDYTYSDVHFIDGQLLDPTDFGEFNAKGIWVPKEYTGTYGANGFHLDFASKTTANDLGLDKAPISGTHPAANNWTTTGISVAAGVTYDAMVDTPTDNFATLNELQTFSSGGAGVMSNAALTATVNTTTLTAVSTIPLSTQKTYAEFTMGAGISASTTLVDVGIYGIDESVVRTGAATYLSNGQKTLDNVSTAFGTAYSSTGAPVIGVAVDPALKQVSFYLDGALQGGGPITWAGTYDKVFIGCATRGTTAGARVINANFGQQPFEFTPPTGFIALSTDNLQPPVAPVASGTFTGNALADGPFVWTGGVPVTLSIDGSANLVGTTNIDVTAGGFKLRSATNNAAGTRSWVATYATPSTNSAFSQPQPAQKNP